MTGTYPPTVGATQDASASGGYRSLGSLSYSLVDGQSASQSFTPQGNGIIDEVRLVWSGAATANGVETTVTVTYAQGGWDQFTQNNTGDTRNHRFTTAEVSSIDVQVFDDAYDGQDRSSTVDVEDHTPAVGLHNHQL